MSISRGNVLPTFLRDISSDAYIWSAREEAQVESTIPEDMQPETPPAEEVPDTPIDTSSAFSGDIAPLKKDPEEMVQKRQEGKLPQQESETSVAAEAARSPDEPPPA